MSLGERVESCLRVALADFAGNNGIVVPEYKSIFGRLVLENAEFGIHIVLHLVVITVQMIRRYVQQDGDVRLEIRTYYRAGKLLSSIT